MLKNSVVGLVVSLSLVACGLSPAELSETRKAQVGLDDIGLLAFLNDQSFADFELLDVACAIRSDSARKIIQYRDGKDKIPGTADDNLFDSVSELDGVTMVGPWTINQLRVCAEDFGYVASDGIGDNADREELTEIRDRAQLDPSVDAKVEELLQDAQQYRETNIIFPMNFLEVVVFTINGRVVRYEISFAQWLDPECGVKLYVRYTLDAALNVIDVYPYV